MPYIKQEDRIKLDEIINKLDIKSDGELNYCITKICLNYLNKLGMKRYTDINEIVGVLECAKLEFYRRQAAPYEDVKIQQNGDVI